MTTPRIENAPGLVLKPRKNGWAAVWQARTDLAQRGFEPKSSTITSIGPEPTDFERAQISDACNRLQSEMLIWGQGGIPTVNEFDGTLRSLIGWYQTDRVSPYRKARYRTRLNYDSLLRRIARDHGAQQVSEIRNRMILAWYDEWCEAGIPIAHSLVSMLRTLLSFGSGILEDKECARVRMLLHDLRFQMVQPRKERLTAQQVIAVRARAHERGWHSVALAQAFQFECTLRQKDVIGEWVPLSEPGLGEVDDARRGTKWQRGLRWQEIDASLILKHVTSKKGKEVVVNLRLAPMVMEELALLPELPANGPVIVNEVTEQPYRAMEFRRRWRICANEVGIPKTVWNMDTRAGAISEATDSGADLEAVRHAATHSNISMTQRYSRGSVEKIETVMRLRAQHRNKTGT